MSSTHLVLACLVSALPGPPGVRYEDAYIQLFPVDKTKCPTIDPVRDIAYHLFTRNNPLMPDVLKIGDDVALEHSHMNFSDPTVIFFHAFFESSMGTTAWTIKTAYLQRKQHNLILLNAPRLEAGPWYFTASRNTRVVGEYTATFIDYLVSRGLQLQSLHLVGLSLGAQMAGVTGSNVKSGRVPRITGLDPAGPIFTKLPKSLKLDKSDAEFVDVIHSDAGIFGYPRAIGHVDFWPNRGISPQPGCHFSEVKKRNPDTILELFFCSHWRSYQFYAESLVNENGFLAVSCKSWNEYATGKCDEGQQPIHMGYGVPKTASGNYFLTTNPESPFSLEANPKTLAESKHKTQENHYPKENSDSQFLIQEGINNSEEENNEDSIVTNLESPVDVAGDSKSAVDNKHETYANNYPEENPNKQFLIQEGINDSKKKDNEDSMVTNPGPTFAVEGDLKATVNNKHKTHEYYYPYASPNKHVLIQEDINNFKDDDNEGSVVTNQRPTYSLETNPGNIKHETHENNYYAHENPDRQFSIQEDINSSKGGNEGSRNNENLYPIINYIQEGYLNENLKVFMGNRYNEPGNYEPQYYSQENSKTPSGNQYFYY